MKNFYDYPQIMHLPFSPVLDENDKIAEYSDLDFMTSSIFSIYEKIDGANCGIALIDDNPVIRNRTKFLSKGNIKDTPASNQFKPIWNWFYENKSKFEKLNSLYQSPMAVYGEWCLALHGIKYSLPSYFMAFDIWDLEKRQFIGYKQAYIDLRTCGFNVVPFLGDKKYNSLEEAKDDLINICNTTKSRFSDEMIEGIIIRTHMNKSFNALKLIRSNYIQGSKWNFAKIQKQELRKGHEQWL